MVGDEAALFFFYLDPDPNRIQLRNTGQGIFSILFETDNQ
jgi:hypothetical protein